MIGVYLVSLLGLCALLPAALLAEKNISQIQTWAKLDEKIFVELEAQKRAAAEILKDNERLLSLRQSCASVLGHPVALAGMQAAAGALVLKQQGAWIDILRSVGRLTSAQFYPDRLPFARRLPAANYCKIPGDLEIVKQGDDVYRCRHASQYAGARLFVKNGADWDYYFPRSLPR